MIAFGQKDYELQIGDSIYNISLNENHSINFGDQKVNVSLKLKDTLTYDDGYFKFQYPSDYKISKVTLEEGVEQIMLMTAAGSGFMFQKYDGINPTMLNEFMISEMTKESLNYGFKMNREYYQRKLKSGQKIIVDKATLTYKDELNIYEIASIGKRDEGLVFVSMIMSYFDEDNGAKLIDFIWDSIELKQF
ncbi:hypothetical protein [Psychroflexus aestuariivivens]|uniref:hypothetical protein n=1 Tax=Psychroflexus aestuariivivens TaxID=1795040 RepID=UPI000FDB8B82|nr:hypothetical protein [Psychroflexus aestuariivivens]